MHKFLLLVCCLFAPFAQAFAGATVRITAPSNASVFAPPASFTVTSVAEAFEDGERISTHTIYRNGAVIASGTTETLSASVSGLAAGTYYFTSNTTTNLGASASSASILVTVAAPGSNAPTVTIGTPTGGPWKAPATLALAATAADSDGTVTKVEFYVDSVLKGSDTSAPYTYSWTNAPAGAHVLTAKAYDNSGNSTLSAPVNITIAQNPPSVSLAGPIGSPWSAPASVGLSATASDADGTVSKVEFYANGVLKATDTTAPYAYNWSNVAAGTYSVTAKAYDNAGNVTTSAAQPVYVAEAAVVRSYKYNTYQELCRIDEPESRTSFMGYDAAGNLVWSAAGYTPATGDCVDQTAVAARRVDRVYDARNRLMSLSFPDGMGNTTRSYYADGKLASMTADNGGANQVTTNYTYNNRGLLINEQMLWGAINWSLGYAYNSNGHLASQSYPGAFLVTFAPNALGQPTQVGTYASGVTYYPNGAIKQFTYGNGVVHTLTQNLRGLPDLSKDAYGATAFLSDGYDYDANGNVAAITDGATSDQRGNRTMTYDDLDRLTDVVSPMYGTTGAHYAYDGFDNLTRVQIGGTYARDHYYCYDGRWQLTNVKTGSCSGTSVIGLGYDEQGNLSNKNGIDYTFDFGNRLRSVDGSPSSSYVYDGNGLRVRDYTTASKYSIYSQAGKLAFDSDFRKGVQHQYLYLGSSLVAIREKETATGVITNKYQHTDALGSPVLVTDGSRIVLGARNEYEPYGKVVAPTSPQDGPGYTGHVFDAATGMNYMQQRYYDPGIGRFLSVDPVAVNSSTGGNFNRYWYANNNPYKFTDPDGRLGRYRPGDAGAAFIGDGMMGGGGGGYQRLPCNDKPQACFAKAKESSPAPAKKTATKRPGYWERAWNHFKTALVEMNDPLSKATEPAEAKTVVIVAGAAAQAKAPVVTPVVKRVGQWTLMYEVSTLFSAAAVGLIAPVQDMQGGGNAPLSFMSPESERNQPKLENED